MDNLQSNPQPNDDPNIVGWNDDNDRKNPMNWSTWKKNLNLGIVALISFMATFASSALAPSAPQVMHELYHGRPNDYLASFVVSVYVLGFAVGPLFIGPLSEVYGRVPMYHICNVIFVAFTVTCAKSTGLNMLMAFRFLAGCSGSAVFALGAGTVADIVEPQQRGSRMALVALGIMLGPVFGPLGGAYLGAVKGWRGVFWLVTMMGGAITSAAFVGLSETYTPVLLKGKTKRFRIQTGTPYLRPRLDPGISQSSLLLRSIGRPLKFLFFSPIVLTLSIFTALGYGYLYMLYTTISNIFATTYGWGPQAVGLTYLGVGVGNTLGMILTGLACDMVLKREAAKGDMKPENRLLPMIYLWPLISVGFLIYGWTAQKHCFWLLPLLGTALFGFGVMATIICISTYLIDAFTNQAASVSAANTLLRSFFGGVIPLFGFKINDALGVGWGSSLLAFIALALAPVPWIFYRFGERLRARGSLVL